MSADDLVRVGSELDGRIFVFDFSDKSRASWAEAGIAKVDADLSSVEEER